MAKEDVPSASSQRGTSVVPATVDTQSHGTMVAEIHDSRGESS